MSLKLCIVAVVGLFLALMAGAGVTVMVADARDAVRAEMRSALELGVALGTALGKRAPADAAALNALGLRHLRFVADASGALPGMPDAEGVPRWFTSLIGVGLQEQRFPDTGLRVIAEPWDEIAEVWEDAVALATTLAVSGLLLLVAAGVVVDRALRPLARLEAGVERLRAGRYGDGFDATPGPGLGGGVSDLRRLGDGIAALAADLSDAERENRRLGRRLVTAQDDERREIARDLHDELGAALFAIKVDAGRVLRLTEGEGGEVAARARAILATAAEVHRVSRRVLQRLRPALLDQLPLSEALAELVAEWARRQPDVAWTLDLDPAAPIDRCDETLRQTLYRLAQESLVNALRHARPSAVALRVTAIDRTLTLTVEDDGPGLDRSAPAGVDGNAGFGISGMAERVAALGGRLTVAAAVGGGTRVTARLPVGALPAPPVSDPQQAPLPPSSQPESVS